MIDRLNEDLMNNVLLILIACFALITVWWSIVFILKGLYSIKLGLNTFVAKMRIYLHRISSLFSSLLYSFFR